MTTRPVPDDLEALRRALIEHFTGNPDEEEKYPCSALDDYTDAIREAARRPLVEALRRIGVEAFDASSARSFWLGLRQAIRGNTVSHLTREDYIAGAKIGALIRALASTERGEKSS